ncbi:unnamed protein product, partial [Iphiclides podalirius]
MGSRLVQRGGWGDSDAASVPFERSGNREADRAVGGEAGAMYPFELHRRGSRCGYRGRSVAPHTSFVRALPGRRRGPCMILARAHLRPFKLNAPSQPPGAGN